ncbi:MAG: hypothetical protein WC897_04245 [Candidatus Gracilibacteria bacterium]
MSVASKTADLPDLDSSPQPGTLDELLTKARAEVTSEGFRRGAQLSKTLTDPTESHRAEILAVIGKYAQALPKDYPQSHFLRPANKPDGTPNARHHWALSPLDRTGNALWIELEQVADKIKGTLTDITAGTDVQTMLLLGNILNSRTANTNQILTINGTGRKISPKEIYDIWKEMDTGANTTDSTQKSIEFCRRIGIELEAGKEKETIRDVKDMAWIFLSKIMRNANDVLAVAEGEETITILGISDTLHNISLFEWLSTLFEKTGDPTLRLEAQLLLKLSLEFFNITNSKAFKNGTQMLPAVDKKVQEVLTPTNETTRYNRLKFKNSGKKTEIEIDINKFKSTPLRRIEIAGFDQFKKRAIFIGFNHKGEESILTKLLTREPDANPEELRDILRCTLVIPDVTTEDLTTNANEEKDYFKAIARKLGEQMGLSYREESTVKDNPLQVGEFTIEDDLQKKDSLFRNIKLLGVLPDPKDPTQIGTTIEIQINPIDLHEVTNGIDSPFGHDKYEAMRNCNVAKNTLAEDLYPQAIAELDKHYARLEEERGKAIKAGIEYTKTRGEQMRREAEDNLGPTTNGESQTPPTDAEGVIGGRNKRLNPKRLLNILLASFRKFLSTHSS